MKRSSILTAVVLALFSLIISPGCGGGGGGGGGVTGDGVDPYVEVTSPNGGEVLNGTSGQTVTITWTASDETALDANPISLSYSTDGGSSYTSIATGEANDGTYTWTLGADIDGNILVRVTAKDASGRTASDESDAAVVMDATAPVIDVTAPSTNQIKNSGETVVITWTATDANLGANPIKIEYEDQAATGTWVTIVAATENDGTYTWTVPGFGSNVVLHLKVTVTDAAGLTASELADDDASPKTVSVSQDLTAPTVTSITYGTYGLAGNPALDSAADVPVADQLIVLFSETMDKTATEGAITLNDGTTDLPLSFYWTETSASNDTVIIVPDTFMEENQTFTLTVSTAAADTASNALGAASTAAFDTVNDMTAPVLTAAVTNNGTAVTESVLPNGANGIYSFTFTFDENISPSNVEFRIESVFDGYDYFKSIVANVVTIELDVDDDGDYGENNGEDGLPRGRGFTIRIEVQDSVGNRTEYDWNIATAINAAQSPDAPYLVSSIPADAGTDIACNLPIYLVFSEALDPSTLASGITISGPSGPLTVDQVEVMAGSLVTLTVDGGFPGSSAITVALTASLEDCGGTAATAGNVLSFTTGAADSSGPAVYSSTVKANDEDIYPMAGILVNLDEMVIEDTVDETTVYFEDALSGAPVRTFRAEVSSDSGELRVYYNGMYGSPLAYNRDYNLVIKGLEDISGNTSDISIPFKTVLDAGTDYAPYINDFEVQAYMYPEWAFMGTASNTIARLLELQVQISDDNNEDTSTVTASDGTNPSWTLSPDGGGDYDYFTDYPTDGDENIVTGSGSITLTINDTQGHTVTYKKNYFIPATIPQQVSPRNAATVDLASGDIPLEWTTPGYANSVVAVSFTKQPGDPMDTDLPVLFVNAEETTVDVPSDFGLTTGYYFWSLLFFRPGFDSETMAINIDTGLVDVFSVIDSSTGYTVSGQVTQTDGPTTGSTIVAIFNDGDSFDSGGPLAVDVLATLPETFTFYSLPDGTYDLMAFRDTNGTLDTEGAPYGELQDVVVSGGNVTGQDFAIAMLYPDLRVTAVSMPVSTAAGGQDIVISRTLDNTLGAADADSFEVSYYFSTDTFLDVGDTYAGNQVIGAGLVQGAASAGGTTLTLPTTTGSYYLIVEIDSNDDEYELSEANNLGVSASPITVTAPGGGTADLRGTIDSSPTVAFEEELITVTVSVTNLGSADAAGPFDSQLYLSDDGTLDAGDTALYNPVKSISNLDIGGSYQYIGQVEIQIPSGTGSKFLLWVVDDGNAQPESNEGNNIDSAAIDIQSPPDLSADGTTIGTEITDGVTTVNVARAGETLDATVDMSEAGGSNGVSDDFDVEVFLSADDVIEPGTDTSIGSDTHSGTIAASGSDSMAVSVTIPSTAAGTTWSVGSFVDSNDDISEPSADVSNIDGVSEVTHLTVLNQQLTPAQLDLAAGDNYWTDLRDASGNWNVFQNGKFSVFVEVENLGGDPGGSFDVGVYLSSDSVIDLSDSLIGTATVTIDNESPFTDVRVDCTANVTLNTYTMGFIVDYPGAVAEVNELNNFSTNNQTIQVVNSGSYIDLKPGDSGGGPELTAITVDEQFAIYADVRCEGNIGTSTPFTVRVYASQDTTVDGTGDDVELTIISNPYSFTETSGISAGYRMNDDMGGEPIICMLETADLGTLTTPITIGYIVDAGDAVAEADETNNAKNVYENITLKAAGAAYPDLMAVLYMETNGEPSAVAPTPPTYYVNAATTAFNLPMLLTANFGEADSAAPDVDFYLSDDQVIGTDTLIGTYADSAFGAGEYRFKFNEIPITSFDALSMTPGTYYLYGEIDPTDAIDEGVSGGEDNNTSEDVMLGTWQLGSWIPVVVDSGTDPELTGLISIDSWGVSDAVYADLMIQNVALDASAGTSAATLWFSEDQNDTQISAGDVFIDIADIQVIQPGSTGEQEVSFYPDFTVWTTNNTYSLKLKVDALDEVTERADEDDIALYTMKCLRAEDFAGGLVGWSVSVAGGGSGWTDGGGYASVDAGATGPADDTAMYRSFDCSSAEEVYLLFEYTYNPDTNTDFYIEIWDGGTNFYRVDDNIDSGNTTAVVNITEYAAGLSTAFVRFVFEDAGGGTGTVTVDNVVVITHP